MRPSPALLVLGAVLAAAAAAAVPSDPSRKSMEGDWETVIASPKRPSNFLLHLKPAGLGWPGSMTVRGLPDLPLSDIRTEATKIHFLFPAELDSIAFDGTLVNGEIVGQALEDGKPTPTRLTRAVPLPKPANRLAAWQQDLDFAGARLLEYDRSFNPGTRKAFQQALAQLKLDLRRKSAAAILVAQNQPYYEELSIQNLEPDIPASMSSKDYFGARDPALTAIEARVGK